MSDATLNVNTLWARVIVDELVRCGLREVCIAPGSRSTPLVAAFAAHEAIEDISIIDERSAAFFALGQALATGRPVALLCTSGTAAANFFPAICEAFRSEVPLVVITADRPPHLQDCGASQSMDQTKLYGGFVRWFHQLDQAEASADKLRYARTVACRAMDRAMGPTPGPVHLNIPLRKPLEPIAVAADHRDAVPPTLGGEAPEAIYGRADGAPFVVMTRGTVEASAATVEAFVAELNRARHPLILAGADHRGESYAPLLDALARRMGAPIIAESTSSLRHGSRAFDSVLSTGELLFESRFYERLGRPDLILRTGKAPLSWTTSAQVNRWSDVRQVVVSSALEPADPEHVVHQWIQGDERSFLKAALALLDETEAPQTTWASMHREADRAARAYFDAHAREHTEEPLSTADAWDVLVTSLPEGAGLFVSNSMPIRDLDAFCARARTSFEVFFNRGVNGIDGIVSTGFGIAQSRASKGTGSPSEPTVIVLGDVALRHDLSALLLASELDLDATLVVLDNDGGAIFEYLPIAGFDTLFERHFATSGRRPLDATVLGEDGLVEPRTRAELERELGHAFETPGLQIIRVKTDRRRDMDTRRSLRRAAAEAIDAIFATEGAK